MLVFQFICLTISIMAITGKSLGSESEFTSACSKFHFEEKVLEKVVRLEHKLEVYTEKFRLWEESISSSLNKVTEAKKLTETFVESMQNAHIQDQMRFNDSFLETKKWTETFVESIRNTHIQDQMRFNVSFLEAVNHFRTQSENETWIYERQMNLLFGSLSSKIQELSKAESRRESVVNLTLHLLHNRFNKSFDRMNNFQVRFNNSLQEIELKQKKVGLTSCASSVYDYVKGSVIKFSDVLSSVGISDTCISTFTSTGKFRCTSEGLYQISVSILSKTSDRRFGIYMNGNLVSKAYTSYTNNYESGTGVAVVALDVNDEVWIEPMDGVFVVNGYASCITIVKM